MNESINIATAVAVFFLVVIVSPLTVYIWRQKDKQIDELKRGQLRLKKAVEDNDKADGGSRQELKDQMHAMALELERVKSEAGVWREVKEDIRKMFNKVDNLGQEVAGLKGMLTGRKPSIPAMPAATGGSR
jgi:hypothetical protein